MSMIFKPVLFTPQPAFLKFESPLLFAVMQPPGFQPLVHYIRIGGCGIQKSAFLRSSWVTLKHNKV